MITYKYGVEVDKWLPEILKVTAGDLSEQTIDFSAEKRFEGNYYFTQVDSDVSILIWDTIYKEDVYHQIHNESSDFICLYYSLSDNKLDVFFDEERVVVGDDGYNLAIMDSSIDFEFVIKEGVRVYMVCVFISKKAYKHYVKKKIGKLNEFEVLDNEEKNDIIAFKHIDYESMLLIEELKSIDNSSLPFDFFLKSTGYGLLATYFNQFVISERVLGKVTKFELRSIIESKDYLLENIDSSFPGIDVLSEKACMSTTRYKSTFKKIFGTTPNAFFISQKLYKSKKLLLNGVSVTEVSEKLSYKTTSYFISQFKQQFGLTPKEYILKF